MSTRNTCQAPEGRRCVAGLPTVSLFLAGPRSDMLPIRMWGMMESTLDVRVAAVSGVLIATGLGLMLVMAGVVGLTRQLRN